MTRRVTAARTKVAWVSKSDTGFNAVFECGHGRIVTGAGMTKEERQGIREAAAGGGHWEALLPPGFRPGDEVECQHCPEIVVDDMAAFARLRRELGTE